MKVKTKDKLGKNKPLPSSKITKVEEENLFAFIPNRKKPLLRNKTIVVGCGRLGASIANKGNKDGRFNKYQAVWYCALSMEDLLEEVSAYDTDIRGSLIIADVVQPIYIAYPDTEVEFMFSKAICSTTDTSNIAKMFSEKLPYYHIDTYDDTNEMFTKLMKSNPELDGYGYPSANGINLMNNGILYYMGETNPVSNYIQNVALLRKGFDKLKCHQPIVYWHNKK